METAYDDVFYSNHSETAVPAARAYLSHLWAFFHPSSILDVGCGRGGWLLVAKQLGCPTLLGLDGGWNEQSKMLDPTIDFQAVDLAEQWSLPRRFDLAICLEVAEHLAPKYAGRFLQNLTNTADAVLFSSAYIGQGGVDHVNENRHSYWGELFAGHGYVVFDLFRPFFWGNQSIRFWYRQNVFLYARSGSAVHRTLLDKGLGVVPDVAFLDCVHPDLYDARRGLVSFSVHLRDFFPSFGRALRTRRARWMMRRRGTSA